MRVLVLILTVLCASGACFAQAKNSRDSMGFVGRVRAVEFEFEVRQ